MADTQYQSHPFIFASKGIVARYATDRVPVGGYLNLLGWYEREEEAMSSRYGSVMVNRDPDPTGNGQNYLLPDPVQSLTRLKYNDSTWRYAGAGTKLYRRAGDVQGPYTSIYDGLSGKPFGSSVTSCFASSQPYIFIADQAVMRKDSGTGTPTKWGITPPCQPANTAEFAPFVLMIDDFRADPSSYSIENMDDWIEDEIGTVTASAGSAVNDFIQYTGDVTNLLAAFNGVVAKPAATVPQAKFNVTKAEFAEDYVNAAGQTAWNFITFHLDSAPGFIVGQSILAQNMFEAPFNGDFEISSIIDERTFQVYLDFESPFLASNGGTVENLDSGLVSDGPVSVLFNLYSKPNPDQFSAVGVGGMLEATPNSFAMTGRVGGVTANATGAISKTVDLDLDQRGQVTGDDLIALSMQLSDPAGISEIKLMFDVNNSGYTSSYYYKTISPAYYQSGISGDTDAYTTASSEILALSLGLLVGSMDQQGDVDDVVSKLRSTSANTGPQAWSTIYNRRGDFLAVGNAGESGLDWSNITGWKIQIQTTTTSSVTIAVNGLYLQWGSGPSSFGGTGYDYRYIYFNANTQTPSNPSGQQYFSAQYGFVGSYMAPFVLRQGMRVTGAYSLDPQVTHIRIYRRGGSMNQNWFYVDQIPNDTEGGTFSFRDNIADAELLQADVLQLDNDPPITSSLQQPIVTTLTKAVTSPGTTPYDVFLPQMVSVADPKASFIPSQLVVVGNPQNLEQVRVVDGGRGSFTAVCRLHHSQGEQVQVYSIPEQPCDLVTLAYNRQWVAGDPNNPHFLYYSKPGFPENFSPQNYIPIGSPASPIMAVVNFRGSLLVATLTTWYQVVPGNAPYAQPTGSRHGLVSKTGWTMAEGSIWYQAIDGVREFRGADGPYRSLPIEWVYQGVAKTPLPLMDPAYRSDVSFGFLFNTVYTAYRGVDGSIHRNIWSSDYQRWRNDNVPAVAMYYEEDISSLLYAKQTTIDGVTGYAICRDRIGDTDDGGWVGGKLTKRSIDLDLQTPFQDVNQPHNKKNWNVVEVDANTNGQDIDVSLIFDDDIPSLKIGTVNTVTRQKVQLNVLEGEGVESYKASLRMTGSVLAPPSIYQSNIYTAPLASVRKSLDTYWLDFGTEESKMVKQLYLDYKSVEDVVVSVYADGASVPYYQTKFPPRPNRAVIRMRLKPLKLRKFRMIILSKSDMQVWAKPRLEWKNMQVGHAWSLYEVIS